MGRKVKKPIDLEKNKTVICLSTLRLKSLKKQWAILFSLKSIILKQLATSHSQKYNLQNTCYLIVSRIFSGEQNMLIIFLDTKWASQHFQTTPEITLLAQYLAANTFFSQMTSKTVILCHQGGAASDIRDRDCTVVTLIQTCNQVENV